MDVKLGDTRRFAFGTSDASTGAAADADSTPTATVYEQGTAMGYAPTVTNKAVGLYEVAVVCSSGNGFEVDKEYTVTIAATVGGQTGRDGLAAFKVRANSLDDACTKIDAVDDYVDTEIAAILAAVDTEIAAIKAKTDNLPADPADESNIQAMLTTIAGYIDTEIADIRNRLPAALVGGRMDSSVGVMQANTLTASALAADAVAELVAAILAAEPIAGRTVKGILARWNQMVVGRHTGMVGPTWRLYGPDGSTVWVEAAQNVGLGTRDAATTILGE